MYSRMERVGATRRSMSAAMRTKQPRTLRTSVMTEHVHTHREAFCYCCVRRGAHEGRNRTTRMVKKRTRGTEGTESHLEYPACGLLQYVLIIYAVGRAWTRWRA